MHENTSLEKNTRPFQSPSDGFFKSMQKLVDPSSPMTLENNASTTSKGRKEKGLGKDPTLNAIFHIVQQFVKMGFKAMAEYTIQNTEIVDLIEASPKEVEEKKKLIR